jgi:hypothetical protein
MTARSLPPPCPVCGGQTALKTTHRLPKDGGVMCFFRCLPCALEYPVAVEAAEALRAGLSLIGAARDST